MAREATPGTTPGTAQETTDAVLRPSGASIGYRILGRGPGLVLLHGAMSSGAHHLQLAEALGRRRTVYLVDRRGRGRSAAAPVPAGLAVEVDDLVAVLARTGATCVLGVSSGAIVCLEAARTRPAIHQAVLFEPPLQSDRTVARAHAAALRRQLAAERLGAALVTGMKAGQVAPRTLRLLPTWMLAPVVTAGLRAEEHRSGTGYPTTAELAPTLLQDFGVVADASGPPDRFAAVGARVQLLGGGDGPAHLRRTMRTLESVLPHVSWAGLPGLGHAAPWNTDRGGHPRTVADTVLRFLDG